MVDDVKTTVGFSVFVVEVVLEVVDDDDAIDEKCATGNDSTPTPDS